MARNIRSFRELPPDQVPPTAVATRAWAAGRKLPGQTVDFGGMRIFLALLAALILFTPRLAMAGGLYVNEFSTTSQANAGAGRGAWVPDASAALHNPAAMTQLDQHGLAGGLSIVAGNVRFDPASDSPNGTKSGGNQVGVAPLTALNYVHHVSDRVRFGLSVYTPSGSALDPDNDSAGRFEMTEISLLTISISPLVAIEVTDWLSIGGGPIATYGRLNWDLVAGFPLIPPGSESKVRLEDFDDWQASGRVGLLLHPTKQFSLSVTYLSETDFKMSGSLKLPSGLAANLDVELPLAQSVEVSAAWQVTKDLMLLATFNWEDWSEANHLELSLPGRTIGVATGFQDTFKIGAGANYRLREDWLLQMGFMFDSSAFNNNDRITALPIDQQIRAAIGFQHELNESLTIGGSFVYANLGQGEVNQQTVRGDYRRNDVFVLGVTLSFKTLPWAGKLSYSAANQTAMR